MGLCLLTAGQTDGVSNVEVLNDFQDHSAVLVCVLMHSSVVAENQPQSATQSVIKMQQVLHKAQDKNKVVKVAVQKKVGNQRSLRGES